MQIIVTLSDLIWIGIMIIGILILGVAFLVGWLKASYDMKFKQNCFVCKHYKLHSVAGVGDRCWYHCQKCDRTDAHSMNDRHKFIKCDMFERGDTNA